MLKFFSFCKDMYEAPIDVADYFAEVHQRDAKRFRNFEISFWQHIKNTVGYTFHEVVLLFSILVNQCSKNDIGNSLSKKLFFVMIKFTSFYFYMNIKSNFQYLYVLTRSHLKT